MDLRLQGLVALVTGATSGIGLAVTEMLLDEGCRVMMTGTADESFDRSKDSLAAREAQVGRVTGRIERPGASEHFIQATKERFGALDIVVNNAASYEYKSYDDFRREDWSSLFEQKLVGYERIIHTAIPHLLDRGGGSIVNVAGVAALTANSETPQVGAVNAGLINLTRFFALKLAGRGVRVNGVTPGPVRTARYEARVRRLREQGWSAADAEAQLRQAVPSRHIIEPREVAMVVSMLSSPELTGMTGANVVIDSGRTLLGCSI